MSSSSLPNRQFSALQQAAYQLASCTDQIFQQIEHQQTLTRIIDKIRASLDLETLLNTTVSEIRQLLNSDRVGVFRFALEGKWDKGEFVAEDVASDLPSALGAGDVDLCLASQFAVYYSQGQVKAVADIYEERLSEHQIQILERFNVRADLVVPVLKGEALWGLLCIHQCNHPRRWQLPEIEFIKKIADHFAVALQQSEYLEQIKQQATLLAQTEAQQKALMRQKALVKVVSKIRQPLDFGEICQTATDEVRYVLKADRVAIYRFNSDWSGDFLYESVDSQWISLIDGQYRNLLISKNVSDCSVKLLGKTSTANTYLPADTYLQETEGGPFAQGEVFRVCPDIRQAGFSDCYIEVLESYQVRSYAIIAVYINHKLWGLLAAYQNVAPRQWLEDEVQLLVIIAEQLGIALRQAEYVETIQNQSNELKQTLEELQQSQAQLIQSEKMVSLGQLVAGIAHEINNPVNFIYGNLSHIEGYTTDLLKLVSFYQQSKLESTENLSLSEGIEENDIDVDFILEDLPKTLESMKLGANRIRSIVLSLRNFSRLDEAEVKAVNIHEGIDSTLLILGNRLKANGNRPEIEVIKEYGNLPPVECYPAQINQVFMNLLANAIDSLEEANDDGIRSTPGAIAFHEPQIRIYTQMSRQDQVEIRIRDNGIGIEEESELRIFENFFTTKPAGKGTGLGLAISKKIITEKHFGTISLVSNVERGAEFIIRLPIELKMP